ncbi:MAG: squalene/phytoene synthase family protein [Pseudomonadota bacterium]
MTEACAALVARDDPHLRATALFAPEPARSRLMVLYAFDCELSRAVRASKESLIPRMRLQWWRDVLTEAQEGHAPKAHEVAAPLVTLVRDGVLDPVDLESMVRSREAELDRPLEADGYFTWHKFRFQSLVWAAAAVLAQPKALKEYASPPLCSYVLSAAYVVRNAPAMAAAGEAPLDGHMAGEGWSLLARRQLSEPIRARFAALAEEGLEELGWARGEARLHDPRIRPALLPLARAERVLRLVSNPDFVLDDLDHADRPFEGLRLAWRMAMGRW